LQLVDALLRKKANSRETNLSRTGPFVFGGLGQLSIVASAVAVDIAALVQTIDEHTLSGGLLFGCAVRIIVLFILGGITAILHSEMSNPLGLVQIGIAASALITSYVALSPTDHAGATRAHGSGLLISSAWAANEPEDNNKLQLADFYCDFWKGINPSHCPPACYCAPPPPPAPPPAPKSERPPLPPP
jgi:hypothetical protein